MCVELSWVVPLLTKCGVGVGEGRGRGPPRVGWELHWCGSEGWRRVGPQGRTQTQKKWGFEGWGPRVGAPKGGGPKISRFFLLPSEISLFVLFVEFWWCSKRQGAQMCTFGVLWLWCEAPAAPKKPGFHTTAREPKCAHLRVPALPNTTKNHEKTPRERQRERT